MDLKQEPTQFIVVNELQYLKQSREPGHQNMANAKGYPINPVHETSLWLD